MKLLGSSFSAETRIRASGFVVFSSRVFLRSSGGLGVQAASGTGWERAARSHGGVENTTLRSFRSDPALECSHNFSSSSSFSASFRGRFLLPWALKGEYFAIQFLLQTQSPEPLVHCFGRDLRTVRHDVLQNQKIPSLTFPSTVSPSVATDRYSRRILIRCK